jgi:hypothetical protein
MPEFPELSAFVHLIRQGKGFPGSLKDYQSLKVSVAIFLFSSHRFLLGDSSLFKLSRFAYRWVPQRNLLNVSTQPKGITRRKLSQVRVTNLTGCHLNGLPFLGGSEHRSRGPTCWIHHEKQENLFVYRAVNIWYLPLETYDISLVLFFSCANLRPPPARCLYQSGTRSPCLWHDTQRFF